jgi:hypothetical protein
MLALPAVRLLVVVEVAANVLAGYLGYHEFQTCAHGHRTNMAEVFWRNGHRCTIRKQSYRVRLGVQKA